MITQARVREALSYDPETGVFTNRVRSGSRRGPGDRAGSLTATGYWQIMIDYKVYQQHRLAYLYMTGEWPEHEIDHIDGDRANNRWSNLRDATRLQNGRNRCRSRNNASGMKGVCFDLTRCRWRAGITVGGKYVNLGYFASPEEAHAAYCAAADKHYGEFARHG